MTDLILFLLIFFIMIGRLLEILLNNFTNHDTARKKSFVDKATQCDLVNNGTYIFFFF